MFYKHKLVWFSVAIVVMILASMGASVVMAKTVLKPINKDGITSKPEGCGWSTVKRM